METRTTQPMTTRERSEAYGQAIRALIQEAHPDTEALQEYMAARMRMLDDQAEIEDAEEAVAAAQESAEYWREEARRGPNDARKEAREFRQQAELEMVDARLELRRIRDRQAGITHEAIE